MLKRSTIIIGTTSLLFILTGCGNSVPHLPETISVSGADFVYHGHNFGPDRTEAYKAGVIAGCRTSDGEYTKDHTQFRTSIDYHDGWEHGRLHCKGTPDSQS